MVPSIYLQDGDLIGRTWECGDGQITCVPVVGTPCVVIDGVTDIGLLPSPPLPALPLPLPALLLLCRLVGITQARFKVEFGQPTDAGFVPHAPHQLGVMSLHVCVCCVCACVQRVWCGELPQGEPTTGL